MATRKKAKRKSRRKNVGLKANGQLKKGHRYLKGGRIVSTKKK